MRVAERRSLGANGLGAIIEGSAIGHAVERSRPEAVYIGEAVTPEKLVAGVEIVIDASVERIGVVGPVPVDEIVGIQNRAGRRGIELHELESVGIHPAGRHYISRERVAHETAARGLRGRRVEDGAGGKGSSRGVGAAAALQSDQVGEIGEAAGPLPEGGNGGCDGDRLAEARAFVIGKPKSLIALDPAAGRAAELVLAEGPSGLAVGVLEEVGGVEFVVAQELPNAAVNLVRARFQRGVEHRAARAAKLGAERVGLEFELANGVHRRLEHIGGATEKVDIVAVIVDAIE